MDTRDEHACRKLGLFVRSNTITTASPSTTFIHNGFVQEAFKQVERTELLHGTGGSLQGLLVVCGHQQTDLLVCGQLFTCVEEVSVNPTYS